MSRPTDPVQRVILVTGPSGAGRTTAIGALEDLGYEAVATLPMRLLAGLLDAEAGQVALGLAPSTRGFSAARLLDTLAALRARPGTVVRLVQLDAAPEVLLRRYSETRRRHPADADDPAAGIAAERAALAPLMEAADEIVDTSRLSPHDLKARMAALAADGDGGGAMAVSVESFSYKRGAPPGLDLVVDLRFLANPHWVEALRPLTGRDALVRDHVAADPRFAPTRDRILDLLGVALPGHRDEGRAYVTLGLGCTGGRHRSVAMAETLGAALAEAGWRVSIRHRELDGAETPTAEGTG